MNAKILFPTDFSATSKATLELATSFARQQGATLLIIHVKEPPLVFSGVDFDYRPEVSLEEALQMLNAVVPTDANVSVEHRLITGIPGQAIVHLAETEKVNLIVMASHGRTGLSRVLMGSVAEEVVRKAPCPVITLKSVAGVKSTAHPAVVGTTSG